jgi:hypothetical protein
MGHHIILINLKRHWLMLICPQGSMGYSCLVQTKRKSLADSNKFRILEMKISLVKKILWLGENNINNLSVFSMT